MKGVVVNSIANPVQTAHAIKAMLSPQSIVIMGASEQLTKINGRPLKFLLEKGYDDFYFFTCSRYSAESFLISAQEQVSARRAFGLFRIFILPNDVESLAQSIRESIRDKNIKIYMHDVREL